MTAMMAAIGLMPAAVFYWVYRKKAKHLTGTRDLAIKHHI
jgi:hypothetical protein